jgi:ferredoxin
LDVRAYAWRGEPIHDARCLTCGECALRCPRGVLRFTTTTISSQRERKEGSE